MDAQVVDNPSEHRFELPVGEALALAYYKDETRRLYGVLDRRLAQAECLAGEYSIADIASYPWVARHEWHQIELADFPNVKRWFDAIGARAAVERGMKVPG